MDQFFLKILPNQELVRCGKLQVSKYKSDLNYFVKDRKVDIVEPIEALQWLQENIQNSDNSNSKVIFFIHGFWASLPITLHRTASVFKKKYFKDKDSNVKAIVHILWDANAIYYHQSMSSIRYSNQCLTKVFNSIGDAIKTKHSLMCHSMGNRFLFESLRKNQVEVMFEELIMIAPDMHFTHFKDNYKLFSAIANNVTVFYHEKDITLRMSRFINKIERLGRVSIDIPDSKIEFIDFTKLDDIKTLHDGLMKHIYFLTSDKVRILIEQILSKKNAL